MPDYGVFMPHYHAVVWLDHAEARVFQFNAAETESNTVHAHASQHGAAHGSPRVHHKSGVIGAGKVQEEPDFFNRVAVALQGAGEVLIAGPGQAKMEFVKHLAKHEKTVSGKVMAVEAMDHATDGQIVAHARNYFARSDRMRPQIG